MKFTRQTESADTKDDQDEEQKSSSLLPYFILIILNICGFIPHGLDPRPSAFIRG
jgi:hypothetical protein